MKRSFKMLFLFGAVLATQACAHVKSKDPDKDAAHKRANRSEYAEEAQSSK